MECVPLTVLGWILPVTIGRLVMRQETAPLPYWGPCEIDVKYFSREVNEQKRTPEALALLACNFLRFCQSNPVVLTSKSVDASWAQIQPFTSREKY